MSRIFMIILICLLLSSGCMRKDKEYLFIEKISLTNETQNNILFYFEMSHSFQNTLSVNGNGYVYLSDTTMVIAKSFYGAMRNYPVRIIKLYELYDLTDTMNYTLQLNAYSVLSNTDSLFLKYVGQNEKVVERERIRTIECNMIYEKNIKKRIMQKDYSMLEKFPEYYSK